VLKDFRQFILRGNVVDLAIAVVIGASFNSVVQSLVRDMITPLLAIFGSKANFSQLSFSLGHSVFTYGDFLNSLVSFLLTATVVFFFVVQPVNRLVTLVKGDEPTVPTTRQCPECKSDIPLDASRCKFCTAKVKPEETSEELAARIADAA
jgi:large conductance mechanosensitive channel